MCVTLRNAAPGDNHKPLTPKPLTILKEYIEIIVVEERTKTCYKRW